MRRWCAALALTAAMGCGDSGASEPDAERFPGVAAALNLDLDAPANYTHPAWPTYYDADARTLDNTPFANLGTDRGATLGVRFVLKHEIESPVPRPWHRNVGGMSRARPRRTSRAALSG